MKNRLFAIFLATALAVPVLTGCSAQRAEQKLESAGRTVESRAESIGETMKQALENTRAAETTRASESTRSTENTHGKETTHATESTRAARTADPAISLEEAKNIALKHAGFTADQVTALHAEYEIEHGIPQYDVEFHYEHWEYDYEINAETGEIISFSKDD